MNTLNIKRTKPKLFTESGLSTTYKKMIKRPFRIVVDPKTGIITSTNAYPFTTEELKEIYRSDANKNQNHKASLDTAIKVLEDLYQEQVRGIHSLSKKIEKEKEKLNNTLNTIYTLKESGIE